MSKWASHWRLSLFLPGYYLLAYLAALAVDLWPGMNQAVQLAGATFILPLIILSAPFLDILGAFGLVEGVIFPLPRPLGILIVALAYGLIAHIALAFLPARWKRPERPFRLWLILVVAMVGLGGLGSLAFVYGAEIH